MTIHVKQHYRTVNGKLVLVHEHDQKGEAAQHHEPVHHEQAVDNEFEKLFGSHEPEAQAAAPEPDVDSEFDKLFGEQTDAEFDKLFGEDADLENFKLTPEENKALSVQGVAKQPEGSKLLFPNGAYVRKAGKKLAYAGPFNYKVKNAIKDQCPGSKWDKNAKEWLVPEEHASALNAIMEEHVGAPHGYTVPEESQATKDTDFSSGWKPFKVGEKVPAKSLKIGMKLKTPGGGIYTVSDVTADDVFLAGPGGAQPIISKDSWDESIDLVYAGEGEQAQPKPTNSGPKVGGKVPFDQLKVGMVFKTSNHPITIDSIHGNALYAHSSEAPKIDYSQDEWEKFGFTFMSSDGERKDHGPKIGQPVDFSDLDVGMVIQTSGGDQLCVVDNDSSPLWVQDQNGYLFELNSSSYDKNAWKLAGNNGEGFKPKALDPGLHVGDTKTINGKTYILNANHRWELADGTEAAQPEAEGVLAQVQGLTNGQSVLIDGVMVKKSSYSGNLIIAKNDENGKPLPKKLKDALKEMHPAGYKKKQQYFLVGPDKMAEFAQAMEGQKTGALKAKPKPKAAPKPAFTPVALPENFPYKQIGPQKGSNPGGLYEDAYGKKWYIKFPASEDHAKNELLAAKLYKLAGVDAPHLKLVKKDGQVGIASAFQEGLSENSAALKAGAPGAKEGFGADAWLANWDTAGLSYDNMPVDKDGKAIRIDVGGSLLYRAQGGPKGDAFGTTVPEVDTLRDAAKNPVTASIFGSMNERDLNRSVANVLSIPDDVIETACMKFGPGDDAAKKELAKKLIARKKYLAKRFPEADKIANPPAPDPTKLTVDPAKLPKIPDFSNWNGQGKGLSGNEKVNAVNQQAVQTIYDFALKGNLVALKEMKLEVVNKDTGESTVKPAWEHPSQHVRAFYDEVVSYMDVIANPASTKAKQWDLEDVSDIRELSDAFKPHLYGVSVAKVPANERLGFWISLGNAADPQQFAPKEQKNVSSTIKAQGKQDYAKMPSILQGWLGSVQGSGSNNQPYRDGSEKDHQGRNTRDVLEAAYAHATEFPEGTTIRKWINMPKDMVKQIEAAADGHVFQNPGSMCCSMSDSWEGGTGSGFGDHLLTIRYAKGAKGLATYGSGGYSSEQEITTVPGQRFMILNKGKTKKGTLHLELLMLPPDQTYIDNIKPKAAA